MKQQPKKQRSLRISPLTKVGMILLGSLLMIGMEEMIRFHNNEVITPVFGHMMMDQRNSWKVHHEWRTNKNNITIDEAHQQHQQEIMEHQKGQKGILSGELTVNGANNAMRRNNNASDAPPGDKALILNILKVAGLTEIPEASLQLLPTTQTLESMYGQIREPIIYGLETCQRYREMVNASRRITGPRMALRLRSACAKRG